MTMIETANKIASDELHHIKDAEIAALYRENTRLRARLAVETIEYEVIRGQLRRIEPEPIWVEAV